MLTSTPLSDPTKKQAGQLKIASSRLASFVDAQPGGPVLRLKFWIGLIWQVKTILVPLWGWESHPTDPTIVFFFFLHFCRLMAEVCFESVGSLLWDENQPAYCSLYTLNGFLDVGSSALDP